MLRDLHLTMAATPDYRAPRCAGHGCPHKVLTEQRVEDVIRKVSAIPCQHFHSSGEPAALWARTNPDGTCPHFEEIKT